MASKTSLAQRNTSLELNKLKTEVSRLRSALIGLLGEDEEGEYNPFFVKKILKAVSEPAHFTFKDKKTFLAQLKK